MEILPPTSKIREKQYPKKKFFGKVIPYGLFNGVRRIIAESPVSPAGLPGHKTKEQGFVYKGKKFIHHTELPPQETALYNFAAGQKLLFLVLAAVFSAALLVNWHATLLVLLSLFTFIYFFDVVFNLFLVLRSFTHQPEINISREETQAVPGATWPSYTIFCPLYKEWEVVPQFVSAMKNLDYPAGQLQIILLLEEDDKKTIQAVKAMDLPENFQAVVVPDSLPKTKPKAMNYGLKFAQGEYIVIYDAEDVPDPLQLKKAVLAFSKAPAGTVCVQAKLNFYNPRQNLLTKVFTAEYSLWFDLVLPGLQSVDGPIPLGGTSNHFRTKDLRALKGWDAFNVTEDCDLGIRLAKQGYKTAIFNSTTWEEANSAFKNWYRQRSRWIKGYMQTFLVHMRQWRLFIANRKMRDLVLFQLTVGGKVVSIFINPLMWALTVVYFAFRKTLGPTIESFFPGPILYMGVFAFVFGNFFYFYHYMIGCAKRGFDGLIKYTFLVPLYWLGMSLSAWKALFEFLFKPHYWAKTVHGLHLHQELAQKKILKQPLPKAPFSGHPMLARQASRLKALVQSPSQAAGGGVLVGAIVLANAFNLLFNIVLGRALSLEEFGVLTLFNTLSVFVGILSSALDTTVNHRTAYVAAKSGPLAGLKFRARLLPKAWIAAGLLSLAWLVLAPVMLPFFRIPQLALGLLYAPAIAFGILAAIDRGFLQGNARFALVGAAVLGEAAVKFLAAIALVVAGLQAWVVLALPVSLAAAFLLARVLALKVKGNYLAASRRSGINAVPAYRFPRRFFAAAALTGLSTIAFFSLDVILAKRFLDPGAAGEYALLSLAGKMVFYFGSLLGIFIVTYTSRDEGQGKDPNPLFYRLLSLTGLLAMGAALGLSLLGGTLMPWLFGNKATAILPYLPAYATAIAMFTLANAFVVFHLARKHLLFSLVAVFMSALLGFGIWQNHAGIGSIVMAVMAASAAYLGVAAGLHLLQRNGKFIVRNLVDLIDAFFPLAEAQAEAGGKKILVFNWRDTRHVYAGGAEVYVHELAKRWVKAGHHVTVFCGNDSQSPRTETLDGVRIVRRGGFYFVYVWAFVYYLLQFRGKFDLIIDCHNGIPFFTPLYAREPVVCLLHHVHQEVFRKYLSRPLALLAQVLENRLMPWAYVRTRFVTISNSSKRNMQDLGLGGAGIDILHPGVDLSFLQPGRKSPQPLVLYLGRLKAYKSVDVLLKAFKNIIAKVPKARLVIAGSGEEDRRLQSLANRLGLADQVLFTGKITEQEKLSWLQRAWVLANPSLVEGWGITTIEANACGVPVVAADVAGLRDSVQNPHTGFLVRHGDVEGFSQKILRLLKNHKLRLEMGNNAVKWAQNFDWDKISLAGLKALAADSKNLATDTLQKPLEITP